MAAILNARDIALQATSPRTLPVTLPSTYNTSGDHTGTLTGSGQTNFQNGQITFSSTGTLNNAGGGSLTSLNNVGGNFTGNWNSLIQSLHQNNQISLSSTGALNNAGGGFLSSLNNVGGNYLGSWEGAGRTVHRNDQITMGSTGTLNGAGGGAITNLDYGNVGGSKPPASATENFFTRSSGNPSGGSTGDAHWNTSTSTMWFNTNGTWAVGGTVNANQITVGTLAAARIASNSVTTDKLNVGTLSAITPDLGTVTSGTISTSGTIRATGSTAQAGSSYSAVFNANGSAARAIYGWKGIVGVNTGGGDAVLGQASGGGAGGQFTGSSGSNALEAFGPILLQGQITIQAQTISGLGVAGANVTGTVPSAANCQNAVNASNVPGSGVNGTVASASNASNATNSSNTSAMSGVAAASWCRLMVTDSGTASASSSGFVLQAAASTGVRFRATGGRSILVELLPSDRRLKKDEQDEQLGIDFIRKLSPKTFRYKDNDKFLMHGFMAQDIEDILGDARDPLDSIVYTREDGYKVVGRVDLIAPMVKSIQELSDKLEAALLRIKKLESR